MVNKKAVSLMVSYVILISIVIGLSIGVYAWLKDYSNLTSKVDCKEGTSLFLYDYNYTGGIINLSLKNNGYFNISGFMMSVSNESGRAPIDLLNATGAGTEGFPSGHYYFDPPLKPGEIEDAAFNGDNISVIQIQPFILDEKGEKIMCEQAVIKQNIFVYVAKKECAVEGDCAPDYYSANYCLVNGLYRDFYNYSCVDYECIENIVPELVESCYLCINKKCILGLVSWWKLNETSGLIASDSVGNNNGILYNMDDSDWVAGKSGNALEFDGVNDYVQIPNFTASNWTIALWVKYLGTSYGNQYTLLGFDNFPSTPRDAILVKAFNSTNYGFSSIANNIGGQSYPLATIANWNHLVIRHTDSPIIWYEIVADISTNPAYNGTLTETIINITKISSLNSADYSKINKSDNNSFTIPGSTTALDTFLFVNFTIPSNYNSIIATTWSNTSATTGQIKMALWNFTSGKWTSVASRTGSLTPVNLDYTISNFADFVSNNQVRVMAYDSSIASVILRVDYIGLNVSVNSGVVQGYVNGQQAGSSFIVGSGQRTFQNGRLAAHYYSGSTQEFAKCQIDEVMIFNRSLSQQDILDIYGYYTS